MEMKSLIYILSIVISLVMMIYLIKKYHLTKYQVFIIVLLILFWSANIIIRAYRKSYAMFDSNLGGLGLGSQVAASIASGYGLMSLFARFGVFYISDIFKSKKIMISTGLVLLLISNIWVLITPGHNSLFFNSLMLGVGGSMLSLFNVLFAQSFKKEDTMISVSILSIAPLLAEFMMSPFQYALTDDNHQNYPALWFISSVICIIAIIFLFFVKENINIERKITRKHFEYISHKWSIWVLGFVGIIISLIKFSTSGSNLITYFQSSLIKMNAFLVAYSDFLFSFSQLFAGVLAGIYLSKKFSMYQILFLGIGLECIYLLILIFNVNSLILFFSCILAGFSYGLTYNSLIGLALATFDIKYQEISMVLFQTLFAIGIFFGDKIYSIILSLFVGVNENTLIFWIMFILSLLLLLIINLLKQKEII